MKRFFVWLAVLAFAAAPLCGSSLAAAPAPVIRDPAVAGLFYPRDPDVLSRTIDGYLAAAKTSREGALRALICPHAGYPYSGPSPRPAFDCCAAPTTIMSLF